MLFKTNLIFKYEGGKGHREQSSLPFFPLMSCKMISLNYIPSSQNFDITLLNLLANPHPRQPLLWILLIIFPPKEKPFIGVIFWSLLPQIGSPSYPPGHWWQWCKAYPHFRQLTPKEKKGGRGKTWTLQFCSFYNKVISMLNTFSSFNGP